MFYRRLLLLSGIAVAVAVVLALQMARLTLVHGAERRRQAEAALQQTQLIPTIRGRILDRRGLVLAEDRPGYDVAISYEVITGEWAFSKAASEARKANANRWAELSPHARERAILELLPQYERQLDQMWQTLSDLTGEDRAELDQRRATIIAWVTGMATHLYADWLRQRQELLDEPVSLSDVAQPIREQRMAHVLVNDISTSALAHIRSFIAEAEVEPNLAVWQHVKIEPATRRVYPMDQVTVTVDRSSFPGPLRSDKPVTLTVDGPLLHIVGTMRRIWREDVEERPFSRTVDGQTVVDLGGYLPGDTTGRWGIERAQERRLRGLRGKRIVQLDSRSEQFVEPTPGRDVTLTIDAMLQAHIAAILQPELGLMARQPWHEKDPVGPEGEPLCGAAVVLDIASGEILAAVTVPTFSSDLLQTNPDAIWKDYLYRPGINRAVSMPYEPGSTLKALVMAAAVTDGAISVDGTINCIGYLDPPGNPNMYRCWIHKQYNHQHGPLRGDAALCQSCNIFFYTLGRRLGARRLVEWYYRFGLGEPTWCGLADENGGDLPDLTRPITAGTPGFQEHDAIFMAIGQGPVRWTPIQAVNAYATIARGGRVIPPTILLDGDRPAERPHPHDLRLNPAGVKLTMDGLYDAINHRLGTGHHITIDGQRELNINISGVKVYGKSGTAEAAPLREPIDDNGDGLPDRWGEVLRKGDHAWLIAIVQRDDAPRPQYVVAVVVEYAGSGGKVAGPIVNQILYAMRAQGYL